MTVTTIEETLNSIKRRRRDGHYYVYARDLAKICDYDNFQNFENIIHKIITEIFSDTETFNNKGVSIFIDSNNNGEAQLNIDFPENKKP